jgi:hypothetical protein
MATAQSTTYKGVEALITSDTFFLTYAGEKIGFGLCYVTATDYATLDLTSAGSYTINNDDGTGVTLQNVYCVKSVVAQTDKDGAPIIYALYLVDAKYMWRKKYITARYNVKNEDYSGYKSFTLNGGSAWTQAEILAEIETAGNLTSATYTDSLDANIVDYMNVVFDKTDCLSAMTAILDEVQGYMAYDTINNTLKLFHYGKNNATTATKITDNLQYIDYDFSAGIIPVNKEPAQIPTSVSLTFSIYDSTNAEDFNDTTSRFHSISSTSGRPTSYNTNITHDIPAHNLKMVRVSGAFTDIVAMGNEANQRVNNYYGRFEPGTDYIFHRIIDFNIDEMVTGVLWQSGDTTNDEGERTMSVMTHIRTYNFDKFDLDPRQAEVEKIVHEALFLEVDHTPSRILFKSLGGSGGVTSFGKNGGTDYVGDVHVIPGNNVTLTENVPNNGVSIAVENLGGLTGGGGVGSGVVAGGTGGGMVWGAVMYVGAPNANGEYDNLSGAASYLTAGGASRPNSLYVMNNGTYTDASNGSFPSDTVIVSEGVAGITGNITGNGALSIKGDVTTGDILMASTGTLWIEDVTVIDKVSANGVTYISDSTIDDYIDVAVSGARTNFTNVNVLTSGTFNQESYITGCKFNNATLNIDKNYFSANKVTSTLTLGSNCNLTTITGCEIVLLATNGNTNITFNNNIVPGAVALIATDVNWTIGDNIFQDAVTFVNGNTGTFLGNIVVGLLTVWGGGAGLGAIGDSTPLIVNGIFTGWESTTYANNLAGATLATASHNNLQGGMA